jgi:hypothetical protein
MFLREVTSDDMLLFACMMIFGNDYEHAKSITEIQNIDGSMPWKLETIRQDPVLASYYVESNFDPEKEILMTLKAALALEYGKYTRTY